MSITKKVAGASVWGVSSRILNFVFYFMISIIAVKYLSPQEFGVYSLLRTILVYITLMGALGLGQTLNRFLPEYFHHGDVQGAKILISKILFVQASVAVCFILFNYLTSDMWVKIFKVDFKYFLVFIPIVALGMIWRETLSQARIAIYSTRIIFFANALFGFVFAAGSWVMLKMGIGIAAILVSQLVASFIASMIMRWKYFEDQGTSAKKNVGQSVVVDWKRVRKYAGVIVIIGIFNLIVQRQSEVFLIGYFLAPEKVGEYDVAFTFSQMILEFIPGAIWGLALTTYSEYYLKHNTLAEPIKQFYRLLALIILPFTFAGWLMADKMVLVFYGEKMKVAADLARQLFIVHALGFSLVPLGVAIYTLEKAWVRLPLGVFSIVLKLTLGFVLIPRYGLMGAVIGLAITHMVTVVVQYIVIKKMIVKDFQIPFGYIGKLFVSQCVILIIWPLRMISNPVLSLVLIALVFVVLEILIIRVGKFLGEREIALLEHLNFPGKPLLLRILAVKSYA